MSNVREEKRIHRVGVIRNWINEAKQNKATIDKEKLIATASLEFGVSRRTALEYINTLILSGSVTLEYAE
jgi:hypothetical protein